MLSIIYDLPLQILYVSDRSRTFCFDNVFDESTTQEMIYESVVKPLVNNFKDGYNCTVFTYGQTGTGKTYTMGSNPEVKLITCIYRDLDN